MLWRTLSTWALLSESLLLVDAFSFSFSNKPTQCARVTVTVDGGTPPYRLVMVPSGPLAQGPEIRTIVDEEFEESPYTLPPLAFPGGSNFIAVMSDATGIGTGGTSVITDVAHSDNDSCLSTTPTNPLFYLILPQDPTLGQCGSIDIQFTSSAQGDVSLMGLIAGGESFGIPVSRGARSTTWSPIRVPVGTGVMLVAGDRRGAGTGGSTYMLLVQGGPDWCLYDGEAIYSSTDAPYAGGQYATGSGGGTVTGPWDNGLTNGSGSGNEINVGAIVGGVLGGVALLIVLIIFLLLWRRRRSRRSQQEDTKKEADLLKSERPAPINESQLEPTPYYAPSVANTSNTRPETANSHHTPTIGHRPSTSVSTTGGASVAPLVTSAAPPPSAWNGGYNNHYRPTTPSGRSGWEAGTEYTSNGHNSGSEHASGTQTGSIHPTPTPCHTVSSSVHSAGAGTGNGGGSGAGRQEMLKSAEGPSRLRAVNVIQHADGGVIPADPARDSPREGAEEEVVELPPSYNEVRRAEGAPATNP